MQEKSKIFTFLSDEIKTPTPAEAALFTQLEHSFQIS